MYPYSVCAVSSCTANNVSTAGSGLGRKRAQLEEEEGNTELSRKTRTDEDGEEAERERGIQTNDRGETENTLKDGKEQRETDGGAGVKL